MNDLEPLLPSGTTCSFVKECVQNNDGKGLLDHRTQFCYECLLAQLSEMIGDDKPLFKEEPPPWLGRPEEHREEDSKQLQQQRKSKQKAVAMSSKQPKQMVIPKEEVDAFLYKRSHQLSDAQLIHEIMKKKNLDKSAARMFMIQLRRRAKEEKASANVKGSLGSAKAEYVNPPQLLPWCPSKQDLFPRDLFSGLKQNEQTRFLALCQNVMNSEPFRFSHNLKELKDFQRAADPERDNMGSIFVDMIEKNLERDSCIHSHHPLARIENMAPSFVLERWKKRWCDPSFPEAFDSSAPVCSVDWSLRSTFAGSECYPTLTTTILRGAHDKVQLPNLLHRCKLESSGLRSEYDPEVCDTNRILDDNETVVKLCLEYGTQIAMDGTTACHLMSDPFVGHEYSYAVPIRVVQKLHQGTMTNVAVLAKPRILGSVDPTSVQRHFIKNILKNAFLQRRDGVKTSVIEPTACDSSEKESGGSAVPCVEKVVEEDGSEPTERDTTKVGGTSESLSDFTDLLDSILPVLDMPSNRVSSSKTAASSENGRAYSVFSIAGSTILIRSHPPPQCTEGRRCLKGLTLSFQPRVEYAPNAGAMRLSENEAGWNYCKGLLKQSANHALFRTHYIIAAMTGSEQLWNGPTSRQDARRTLSACTNRFARLLDEVSHLTHGDYMLINKQDGFIKILPQLDDITASDCVLDCSKVDITISAPSMRMRDAFNDLEPVIPLQWQIVQGRAPGCYVAIDSKLNCVAKEPLPSAPNLNRKKKRRRTKEAFYGKINSAKKRKHHSFDSGSRDVSIASQGKESQVGDENLSMSLDSES